MASTLTVDPLFVAVTRPAMALGVPFAALLVNGVLTVEVFLMSRQLLLLGIALPLHGIFWLLCQSEPRFFELAQLWGRCRGPAWISGASRPWQASSYGPLPIDLPDARGRRRSVRRLRALR